MLNSFTDWNKEDIQNISRHFSDDKFNKDVKLGFRGTGVRRDASGFYHIEIYGDETTCRIMEEKLPFINQKSIFPISCIQIDEVDFAASAPIASQCPGGSCILQPGGSGIGVLGAWIKRKHIYGKPVGITNNHVAVECNIYPPGTEIYDEYRNKVGTVEKFIPLIKYQLESDINYVDLAWIEPENTNIVDYKIGCSATRPLGDVDLEENYINGDPEIYLCRDNSKVLKGQITAFLVTLRVGNPPQYKFAEVIQLDFGEKGDSGSLILDQNHRIGGMFFATSSSKNGLTKYGYANRWEYVKSISQINFIY